MNGCVLQTPRIAALALFCAALVACGGGGSGTGGPPPTVTPTNTPTQTPGTNTTAQGTVVDDVTGAALAGLKVQLDPWIAYPTPGPTPTPLATTTTDANGHFTISAKNGTYLLVIGSDSVNTPPPGFTTPNPAATDTPIPGASGWKATVHDRIVLSGQTTLVAPTMPPVPLYTPPATETGGAYRIATLSALTEAPCILGYNQERASFALAPAVVDEWLVENSRGFVAEHNSPALGIPGPTPNPTNAWGYLTTGEGIVAGGSNCSNDVVVPSFSNGATTQVYSKNPNSSWYGGIFAEVKPGALTTQGYGVDEYPIDPRVYTDPNVPNWP